MPIRTERLPSSYAPLYCKSHYSFLEGASHPEELLERAAELGIGFPATSRVVVADGRFVDTALGVAYLRLLDREGGIILGSMDVPMPLLGASALEVLGFKVDPVTETLEHS